MTTTTAPTARDYPLTSTQAADRIGVHRNTVLRWTDAGRLPCWRTPGGQRRYSPADLDALRTDRADR